MAAHGVKGEVKVVPLSDFPERFERGSRLWLDGVERTVQSGRWQRSQVIVKLAGVNTRNAAEALRLLAEDEPNANTFPNSETKPIPPAS